METSAEGIPLSARGTAFGIDRRRETGDGATSPTPARSVSNAAQSVAPAALDEEPEAPAPAAAAAATAPPRPGAKIRSFRAPTVPAPRFAPPPPPELAETDGESS